MKLLLLTTLCFLLAVSQGNAQTDSVASPGSSFKTNRSNIVWMGSNYRKEWNTPVKAPVLNLATEKGGLTPIKKGGGKQTKSLRLEDANGREYTLRSIQKFITDKTLPGDLQSQAAADLVSEGVSASYPYASLSMQPLADAAGVPYGKVRLVYVPDDPKLGEFRADFANSLATLEERVPASVDKVFDTEEVTAKLEDDNDNDVDQKALLRARILDMFVMDLDRHEGQWNWGAVDKDKGKTFFPIPKDRDQAFYINDGILPGFVKGRSLVPQLEGFKPAAKSITRFNFAARNLDRFFLNELTEEDWKSAADKFLTQMTDEVIDRAIAQQPHEIRNISGATIASTLKARRNNIVREVMEYYAFISRFVSISGSDKKELYDITRNEDGSAVVQVYKIDKDGNQSSKMYERKFLPLVTKEIRVYGMDGQDKFVVHGNNDKIKIRLIGGGGEDVFENTAKIGPMIYDKVDGGNKITGRFRNRMSNDSMVNSYDKLGYKYPFQSVFATIGYNPDDGLFLGPTFKYIRHGFRKTPYKTLHQFKVSYAFSTKALNALYHGEFISVFGDNTDLIADIDYKGPNATSNFFGYGMNSVYNKTQTGKFRFYRIRYDLGDFSLQLRQRLSKNFMLALGGIYQRYSMDAGDALNVKRNVVLNTVASGLDPATVFKEQSYAGGKLSIILDSRDNLVLPEKGVNWVTNLIKLKGLKVPSYDNVTQINTDFAFYLNLIKDRLTFANRTGGGITLGDGFEFFHAQYLGSDDNLRGYRKQRFAGKSKFYNQAELRLRLANFQTYLFPGALGIMAFVDAGRVWVDNDVVKKFASGYGGGFWFAPLRRLLITFSYAISSEDKIPLVGLSWKF
ncbi:MAG: BamA/TamA family outer membrane protein [Ferruginibacter sp.]|nr:BamA/TamA family outer membrane protein [Chitinophagaceae bacterium]